MFLSRYTMKVQPKVVVYAIVLKWPTSGVLSLGSPIPSNGSTKVTLLGLKDEHFSWKPRSGGGMDVIIHPIPFNKIPSIWAWVFKLEGLKNGQL